MGRKAHREFKSLPLRFSFCLPEIFYPYGKPNRVVAELYSGTVGTLVEQVAISSHENMVVYIVVLNWKMNVKRNECQQAQQACLQKYAFA